MNPKTVLREALSERGIQSKNLQEIHVFCQQSSNWIFSIEFDLEQACNRFIQKFNLLSHEATPIFVRTIKEKLGDIAVALQDVRRQYTEDGYDSCQVNRELSKIVSQLICAGGLWGEVKRFLKLELFPEYISRILGLKLVLTPKELGILSDFSLKYGGEQDFLFPGVTVSNENVPDLETMAYQTLLGQPSISVRQISGVGGLRADKFWNFSLPFRQFTKAKIQEDRRFYPGLGLAYMLLDDQDVTLHTGVLNNHPQLRRNLLSILGKFALDSVRIDNLSLLHSQYIPPAWELHRARKNIFHGYSLGLRTRLDLAFHSASHEYARFSKLGWAFQGKADPKEAVESLQHIQHLFTFNSPIHLPWASQIDDLATHFIGRVRNEKGEYCFRYGVGSLPNGPSLEIRLYFVTDRMGQQQVAVCLLLYSDPFFKYVKDIGWIYSPKQFEAQSIEEMGFIDFAVKRLKGEC